MLILIPIDIQIHILCTAYTKLPDLFGKKPAFLATHPSLLLLAHYLLSKQLIASSVQNVQERQLTLLRNVQELPPGFEECCVLVIQITTKEKCTQMLLSSLSLTEIVVGVRK